MKRKISAIIAVLALGLASCGGGESNDVADAISDAAENITEQVEDVVEDAIDEVEEVTSDYSAGETVYTTTCLACHQATGEGITGAFPPLAGSDYLLEDKNRAIAQVINGSNEEIVVNGETYTGAMPAQALDDQQIVDVINYILNSWGNDGGEVTLADVEAQK